MKRELEFYGLLDFFKKRDFIKQEYQNMGKEEKRIYKMYVYSLGFENQEVKDMMWEYLNDNSANLSMPLSYVMLSNEVKKVRERLRRYEKYYKNETAELEPNNRSKPQE